MEIIVLAFATYCLTNILGTSDGPFGVFERLRKRFSPLRCFMCSAVWVAAVLSLTSTTHLTDWFVLTFGLAGAAIFLDELMSGF